MHAWTAKQACRRITATMRARAYYSVLSLYGCAIIVSAARIASFYTSDNPTDKLSALMLESRIVKANKAECFPSAVKVQARK